MGALKPEFTESFEVWTDNYGDFISKKVRPHVAEYCSRTPGVDQPVLPAEEKMPTLWFHVVLSTETSSLTLAVRMDNLYLVGFCKTPASGDTTVWWEFKNDKKTHLIPGSMFLGFGGSYHDLIPGKELYSIWLGRAELSFAVDELAKYKGTTEMISEVEDSPYVEPRSMLATLVIVLCEGLRFLNVSGTVDKKFEKDSGTITQVEAIHVRYWGKICKAVLTDDFSHVDEETGIMDRECAKKIVPLLKYQNSTDEKEDDL